MGENTKIEWADHTFNPWRGCTKVSDGCKLCYAERDSKRNPGTLGVWGPHGTRVIASEAMWAKPRKWNREAAAAGVRKRVFCASLADVFEGAGSMRLGLYSEVRNARVRLFELIEQTPNLDWLLLTKRPHNVVAQVDEVYWGCRCIPSRWPLPNVWLGTSIENQRAADERIPELIRVPAALHWLSVEPLLGPVDLYEVQTPWKWPGKGKASKLDALRGFTSSPRERFELNGIVEERGIVPYVDTEQENRIKWVVAGGESGLEARPTHPMWVRSLRNQCVETGVPFLFKQWGEWADEANFEDAPKLIRGLPRQKLDHLTTMVRVGRTIAGRQFDGVVWDQFPAVAEARS